MKHVLLLVTTLSILPVYAMKRPPLGPVESIYVTTALHTAAAARDIKTCRALLLTPSQPLQPIEGTTFRGAIENAQEAFRQDPSACNSPAIFDKPELRVMSKQVVCWNQAVQKEIKRAKQMLTAQDENGRIPRQCAFKADADEALLMLLDPSRVRNLIFTKYYYALKTSIL